MAYTLNNSITFAQSFIGNLNPTVFTGNEPAMTAANTIVSLMENAPLSWSWNRATVSHDLVTGQQDVTVSTSTFGFLEKCSIALFAGSPPVATFGPFELTDILNTKPLGATSQKGRPSAVAVQISVPGTSATFRFGMAPDQAYNATFTYQKAPVFFTATTQDWFTQCGIPYSYMDVFNPLFLSEMFQFSNDEARAQMYRQRGMAALISKAEGLTAMQKNEILGQYLSDDLQKIAAQLRVQQTSQARVV